MGAAVAFADLGDFRDRESFTPLPCFYCNPLSFHVH